MDSRRWMVVVLAALLVLGLALSMAEAWRSGDWLGAAFSLGPELVGAVVTYVLFDQFIERRERIESEKARLIAEMGSSVNDVAKAAAEKLAQRGWLMDGSLQGTDLWNANLQGTFLSSANLQGVMLWEANLQGAFLINANMQGANLEDANLQGANLQGANLQETILVVANLHGANLRNANMQEADLGDANLHGADLSSANLQGANLYGATLLSANLQETDLRGAILTAAEFNTRTILPDMLKWTPDTDMARFTDPDHPEFWRSDDPNSPAYRGKDSD